VTSVGRVWKFGDDVNTDLIIPGRYLDNYDPAYLAAHAMEGVSKEFAKNVSKGDIIVAGTNFGCGSSREQAVTALRHAGVSAVVAKSFARIFYRNAINLGLPALISDEAFDAFDDGDRVDIEGDSVTSSDGEKSASIEPIPEHVRKILDQGGLVPYIKSRLQQERA
jgi:3-isopropylmalate/(R)-2-methylmalate dehydratase small subunit